MDELVRRGDLAGVQRAVEADPTNLDVQSVVGRTALIHACATKRDAIAQWLIERGANLDLQSEDGQTALITACEYGETEVAKMLIERGANLDLQNRWGHTALIMAMNGKADLAQLLIERGANLDLQSEDGQTALITACAYGETEVAKMLIDCGANLDLQDIEGVTALMLMCGMYDFSGKPDIAQILIKSGAKIDIQDKYGRTALMTSVSREPDTAKLLIERGANLDLQSEDGETALITACECGETEVAKMLIESGANLDLQSRYSGAALAAACTQDQLDLVRMLLDRGAKIDQQGGSDGMTALMTACICSASTPAIVLLLIDRGANIDLLCSDRLTVNALMYACSGRDAADKAKLLIERGAKLDQKDPDGMTALMYACINDQADTVQLLIKRGAELDLWDQRKRYTALFHACENGSFRCVLRCYAAGAKLNPEIYGGRDALDLAKSNNRTDVVAFLEFVTASEVAHVLLDDLRQSQSTLVAFFETDLLTAESCSVLDYDDLKTLGIDTPIRRKQFLRVYNPSALQHLQRRSLPRRASQSVVRVLRRLSGAFHYDAFLTHEWGDDGANHAVVSSVNAMLVDAGKVTWFDEDRLSGDIGQQISDGIETSRKVVVFITARYMHKLQNRGEDYCKEEFSAAARMLDTSAWRGPLQLKLAGHLYIDFTSPRKREENFPQLLERISAR